MRKLFNSKNLFVLTECKIKSIFPGNIRRLYEQRKTKDEHKKPPVETGGKPKLTAYEKTF